MSDSPYKEFKKKLCTFATGQAGIRNPFVIAAVKPPYEHRMTERLDDWAAGIEGDPEPDDGVTIQPIWLDELLPKTTVYQLSVALGGETSTERIEDTMQEQLAEELVAEMLNNEIEAEKLQTQQHIILLLNLGSLYPFTRASELLDELDRRNVKSTIGIPFPGEIIGGKLNFFGGDSRHYYPAHQIDGTINKNHLQ